MKKNVEDKQTNNKRKQMTQLKFDMFIEDEEKALTGKSYDMVLAPNKYNYFAER